MDSSKIDSVSTNSSRVHRCKGPADVYGIAEGNDHSSAADALSKFAHMECASVVGPVVS